MMTLSPRGKSRHDGSPRDGSPRDGSRLDTVLAADLARATRLDAARDPELFRRVFVSLDLPRDANPTIIGVTSAISGEGRTTVALGLAGTLAADLDVPVTLVEADLERPVLTSYFGLDPAPGLCDVLRGTCRFDAVARTVGACRLDAAARTIAEGLAVVPAGVAGADSARLLRQLREHDPLRGEHGLRGLVVLDLPPILNHSFSVLAAGSADAVVLVVRAGVTPAQVAREAIARLERRPQGVVFNGERSALPAWWPGRGL